MADSAESLFLVLGCFGFREDEFIHCPGIQNRILSLDVTLVHYHEIMKYLDGCRLFDRPLFDHNGIRHCLFNLRDQYDQITKPLWSEKRFHSLEKFTIEHRHCGLLLKTILAPTQVVESASPDEEIFIPGAGQSSETNTNKVAKLKLLKG